MAQYHVTHTCGHTHTHHLTGKHSAREWRIGRLEVEACPDCQRVAREQARAAENAKNAEAAKSAGLPTLTGSEKQVAWAETIRLSWVKEVARVFVGLARFPVVAALVEDADPADLTRVGVVADRCEESEETGSADLAAVLRAYATAVRGRTAAAWWIDHRETPLKTLPALFAEEKKAEEEQRAEGLKREAVEEYRESVRRRLYDLFPEMRNWELKVGTWSGCKRVYFGGGYGKNFATLHVTGDRYNSPGSLEGGGKDDGKKATLRDLLAEVAAKWNSITINDAR